MIIGYAKLIECLFKNSQLVQFNVFQVHYNVTKI